MPAANGQRAAGTRQPAIVVASRGFVASDAGTDTPVARCGVPVARCPLAADSARCPLPVARFSRLLRQAFADVPLRRATAPVVHLVRRAGVAQEDAVVGAARGLTGAPRQPRRRTAED